MPDLQQLLKEIEAEARRAPFPIDVPVYEQVGRDPYVPVAYAGDLKARICSFGRDPGRDEIRYAQPQIGAAGKLVRQGVLQAAGEAPQKSDPRLEAALKRVFLSNTVPYKPPGNKAYPDSVKERFRPYIERLLGFHWCGDAVITLGTEAFEWFAKYGESGAAAAFWKREDKYEAEFPCVLTASEGEDSVKRALTICPLPHPSPLNQRWVGLFPGLLQKRLEKWLPRAGSGEGGP
jgi:uracil-DNA glycosylase